MRELRPCGSVVAPEAEAEEVEAVEATERDGAVRCGMAGAEVEEILEEATLRSLETWRNKTEAHKPRQGRTRRNN